MRGNYHARCGAGEKPEVATPEVYLSLFGEIPNFKKYLATMRRYEISCTIILQSVDQIREMYDKGWEGLIGNCDTIVFLGSTENATCEYISKLLGDTTIRVRSFSKSSNKSTSESYSMQKRPLMTPAEVAKINKGRKQRCIVMIRDVDPFFDNKYDFTKHPNFKLIKGNELTPEYMDIYFNSVPYKKEENESNKTDENIKKRDTRKDAANQVLGDSTYDNDETVKKTLDEKGITEDKLNPSVPTEENAKNIDKFADDKNPVVPDDELEKQNIFIPSAEKMKKIKEERKKEMFSSSGTNLSDNAYFF